MPDDIQQTQQVDFANDADFHALPIGEKHKVMLSLDEDYKSLPGSEQVKALNAIHYGGDKQSRSATSRFFSGFMPTKESVEGLAPHVFDKSAPPPTMKEFESMTDPSIEPTKRFNEARKYRSTSDPRSNFTYAPAAAASAFVPGLSPERMEKKADIGDTAGILGESAFPLAVTGASELAARAPAMKAKLSEMREPARIAKGQEQFNAALDTAPGKRGQKAAQMKEDVRVATKDLAAIEKDAPAKTSWLLRRGKGADSFHELAEKIDARQDEMWEAHTKMVDKHPEAPIDKEQVKRAALSVISKESRAANPAEAAAVDKWVEGLDVIDKAKSADNMVREINGDLKGKSELGYGPLQVRARQEAVRAYRTQLEVALQREGETGVRELNRRWGALDNIKGRLQERAVQEYRSEAKQGPLPDWAKMYAFLHPDTVGASIGVGVNAAKALKPNSSSRLTGALRDFGKTSLTAPAGEFPAMQTPQFAPETHAIPVEGWLGRNAPPSGESLWQSGASQDMWPAETSVRPFLDRERMSGHMTGKQAKLLEAPHAEVTTNRTAPDDSSVTAAGPATHVERSAQGRMQRVYEGTAKPQIVGQTADGGPIYEHTPAVERSEQAISHEPIDKIRATRGAKEQGVKGGSDRRSSVRDIQGPDFMRTARANQLRALLVDPALPDADRAIIEAQLDDLKAHPFEKHEGGDINSMKKERRLSREEAEKSSEERKKGRSARFEDIKLKPRNASKIAIEGVDAAHSQEHDRIKIDPFTERYQKNLRKRKLQRA